MGRTHRPFYRICVMDQRKPRNGKAIEEVGTYDTSVKDKAGRVNLKMDRIEHWLSVGAQPSDKVAVLIRKVKEGDWGTVKEPPPMMAPQVKPEPVAEAPAAEGEGGGEEAPAEEGAEG